MYCRGYNMQPSNWCFSFKRFYLTLTLWQALYRVLEKNVVNKPNRHFKPSMNWSQLTSQTHLCLCLVHILCSRFTELPTIPWICQSPVTCFLLFLECSSLANSAKTSSPISKAFYGTGVTLRTLHRESQFLFS